ncbi:MAG: porphobilinogen synthase [Alphaproteobacteria bacterium]|nr:porphobilinogen synthase [Alphaproteobacteria bacterium]
MLKPKETPSNFADLPFTRMRRRRSSDAMRAILRENHLRPEDMIYPLFIEEEITERAAISSMPGVYRETERSFVPIIQQAQKDGIKSVILFGVSRHKDHEGSDSFKRGGLLDRIVKRAKDSCPEMVIIADACFCEYTDHGHCGPLTQHGEVDNDRTIENIAKQAVVAAAAGADVIAPSGMMDGQVRSIRNALDENGFTNTAIMAYAAKYASGFYGPFREAAGCGLGKGNRKTYQMDPANGNEALQETALDIEEGADMVMVKPGLPYLDILWRVKEAFQMPTFVYNVSGEYAMLKAAAEKGWLDYDTAMMEMLISFKRAGADGILTYCALDAAKILNE